MPERSANLAPRWTAAAIAMVDAVWLCYAGAKHALASYYAVSSNLDTWKLATCIEPDNPETWYRPSARPNQSQWSRAIIDPWWLLWRDCDDGELHVGACKQSARFEAHAWSKWAAKH